ncbi:hypothetical protein Tco_1482759 [Tanacetum coccineum]
MEGGIIGTDHAMLLNYVEFHIFPSNNRYDASVLSSNKEEDVSSGPLEQLSLHIPEIKNLSSKGFYTKFKVLPPENVDDARWNELLVAVDLRLTTMKEELAAALNRAIGFKCSPQDMHELSNFALHFGYKNLRSIELTTEDEDSDNSSEEDQPSAKRSQTLSRSTMLRRSASPIRRIQIGRYAGNSSEEEDSLRPPKNNVLKMSVQDKISLFESKQREQGVEINKMKTLSVTVGANKAVLRRWTSSIGDKTDISSPSSPKNVASNGKPETDTNIDQTETCAETSENISLVPEKQAPKQLGVEVNTVELERDETCEKIPAFIEWIQ